MRKIKLREKKISQYNQEEILDIFLPVYRQSKVITSRVLRKSRPTNKNVTTCSGSPAIRNSHLWTIE